MSKETLESYVQITNKAAAEMVLKGAYSELYIKEGDVIRVCNRYRTYLYKLEKSKFFVKLEQK